MSMRDTPFTYRPIDRWPGEYTKRRRRADFSAGWGRTIELLMRELRHLNARQVVVQVDLRERDFRVTDGHPRANAKAGHPGVILAFESKHGPLKFYCDTFTEFDDNMRAIALGLESLRRVERYGITHRDEQYRGWQELPSSRTTGETMSKDEAVRVLLDLAWDGAGDAGDLLDPGDVPNVGYIEAAYKIAVKRHHPDHGGDRRCFEAATEARNTLLNG